MVLRHRAFERGHRVDLAGAQAVDDHGGHCLQPPAQGEAFLQPALERLRPVECEHGSRDRIGIGMVAKQRFRRRGDVFEPDLTFIPDQVLGQVGDVSRCLLGKARKRDAFGLGLDDAAQLAPNEQRIVDRP